VTNTAGTKADAQTMGRQTAMKATVEHHSHEKDGTIGQRNSCGNDPRRRNLTEAQDEDVSVAVEPRGGVRGVMVRRSRA
jgi:hypothetical protein